MKPNRAIAMCDQEVVLTITSKKGKQRLVTVPAFSYAPVKFKLKETDTILVTNRSGVPAELRVLWCEPMDGEK